MLSSGGVNPILIAECGLQIAEYEFKF